MTSRTAFRRFSLPILPCLLLLPLAGCGQGADKEKDQPAANAGSAEAPNPEAQQGEGQGGGRKHGGRAHLTLAGALQSDADVTAACSMSADKTLEITFDPTDPKGSQAQVKIASFKADGEYPATVVIHEQPGAGAAHDWNGTAKVQVQTHDLPGGARKRTAFNGTFSGDYQGQGGKGTLNGQFRRCVIRDMPQ
jgi:hypothetical protein